MRRFIAAVVLLMISVGAMTVKAQNMESFPVTPEWVAKIRGLAPERPSAPVRAKRKVLMFSLSTGYQHWVTPHTAEVIKVLAEKTGAFGVVESNDIEMFARDKIKEFDAVIINNSCSQGKERNLLLDVLNGNYKNTIIVPPNNYSSLTTEQREAKAKELEESICSFVSGGKGLVAIHGAIVFLNDAEKFSELLGGSFDFHPKQQEVTVNIVDPGHPLVKAFEGKPFVHVDEPYLFKGEYEKKNFRPLLVMDTGKLNCGDKQEMVQSDIRYVSWIKKYGKGRVFYVSPAHNAQSFDNPMLLQFYLDGIQYALGDLECDDSPKK